GTRRRGGVRRRLSRGRPSRPSRADAGSPPARRRRAPRAAAAAARSELAVASREVGLPAQGRADQAGHVRVLAGVDVGDLATVVDVDVVVRHQAVLAGAFGPVTAVGQVDGGGAADGAIHPAQLLGGHVLVRRGLLGDLLAGGLLVDGGRLDGLVAGDLLAAPGHGRVQRGPVLARLPVELGAAVPAELVALAVVAAHLGGVDLLLGNDRGPAEGGGLGRRGGAGLLGRLSPQTGEGAGGGDRDVHAPDLGVGVSFLGHHGGDLVRVVGARLDGGVPE